MREFICKECGVKCLDRSPAKSRKFCSKQCQQRWRDKQRAQPIEMPCLYNEGVQCMKPKCDRCGWNPVVEQKRKERLQNVH